MVLNFRDIVCLYCVGEEDLVVKVGRRGLVCLTLYRLSGQADTFSGGGNG